MLNPINTSPLEMHNKLLKSLYLNICNGVIRSLEDWKEDIRCGTVDASLGSLVQVMHCPVNGWETTDPEDQPYVNGFGEIVYQWN